MRVLALVTEAFGGRGGIAQYNRDLLQALAVAPGVSALRVLPREAQAPAPTPAGIHQLSARSTRSSYAAAATVLAAMWAPDLIVCGHLYMAPLAVALAQRGAVPVWLQLHGIDAWQHSSVPRRWAAERCALVSCVSRHTRRQLLHWCNLPPHRVRVLPDTVDPRFCPGTRDEALASRLGLAARRVVLTVGRLAASERYKGHDRVLRCLPGLLARYPDLIYAIAGDGDDRGRLESLARELGVAARVRFLGYVPDADLPALYRLADVFAMPSTGEGFGIVYLQALASGTPVVAGSGDASADPLRDGELGRLVDPSSELELAQAIAQSLGTRVAAGAAAPFSRERFGAATAQLLAGIRSGRFAPGGVG
jgi:phosphatidylinositol alpha-1,6-mannosyltransferase